MTPTTAITAPLIPEHALPDGESNLPVVDAQLMGRPWEEHTLLRAARVIEASVARRTPAHHSTALLG